MLPQFPDTFTLGMKNSREASHGVTKTTCNWSACISCNLQRLTFSLQQNENSGVTLGELHAAVWSNPSLKQLSKHRIHSPRRTEQLGLTFIFRTFQKSRWWWTLRGFVTPILTIVERPTCTSKSWGEMKCAMNLFGSLSWNTKPRAADFPHLQTWIVYFMSGSRKLLARLLVLRSRGLPAPVGYRFQRPRNGLCVFLFDY